jgi:hypothetical protein
MFPAEIIQHFPRVNGCLQFSGFFWREPTHFGCVVTCPQIAGYLSKEGMAPVLVRFGGMGIRRPVVHKNKEGVIANDNFPYLLIGLPLRGLVMTFALLSMASGKTPPSMECSVGSLHKENLFIILHDYHISVFGFHYEPLQFLMLEG